MEKVMRRDLVEAARRGDHEAFEVLATSAGDRMYAVAFLILRAADLAEDAVQEALVRAWKQLPSLRDPDRFDAWLYRLVVNACADQGRQVRRWSQPVRSLPLDPAVGDHAGSVATRDQLERGFRRLKPEQRAVVVLHYYSGFSASEIAEMLGIPEGTARSRLHYATEALRAALEADARLPVVAQERGA
jgi:RNA polymerase sigma-70 factor (ECF subfamily)